MDMVGILDTETTGLDPKQGDCIEVAFVRYSLQCSCMLDAHSFLLPAESNPMFDINGIPDQALDQWSWPAANVWSRVDQLGTRCDAILAHNSDFDFQWVPTTCTNLRSRPWIDTCNAVDWPRQHKPGMSLINLALAHGLGVTNPHRAISDCLLLAQLLHQVVELGYDIHQILAKGLRPMFMFEALVSYENRELASGAGFRWEKRSKQWLRKMAEEDTTALNFAVRKVEK